VKNLSFQNSTLYFQKSGRGLKCLLLFHGFGQHHRVFESWVAALGHQYTLYSFDLFFHGQSQWNSREALEKSDWQEIMTLFFKQESITDFETVGFSMGGKFALATLELFPTKVKKITLLAPDGIKTSFWYSLATYPIATRSLFKSMILHPKRLLWLTKFLRSLHLVDNGLLRFAEHQMNTEEKRRRVYFTWVYFRHLKFDQQHLVRIINQHAISFSMVIGRYDKIITAANMQPFLSKLTKKEFLLIDAGHNDLIDKSITLFIKTQNDNPS
jgi:pimeloyl-ACP methyl ester carboxylesterase